MTCSRFFPEMGYEGKLIGRGRIASVYKVDSDGDSYARKEYHPTATANLLNRIFYNSPHP